MTTIAQIKDARLVAEMQSRGYTVTKPKPEDWITLAALARKCGVFPSSLNRTLMRFPNAPGITFETSPKTRRRRACCVTKDFYEWFNARKGTRK